jgi:hypothetical protein
MLTCELEQEALDPALVVGHDPGAAGGGRLAGEVLARGVAGRVIEAGEEDAAGRVLLDVAQAARARGLLACLLDLVEVLVQPGAEGAGLAGAGEQERRRPLHGVVHDRRLDATGRADQLHPAVVAGHQGALGGGHGDVEVALRVLPVNQQRPRQAQRHLGDADEILYVSGDFRGVEGVGGHMVQPRVRVLLGEGPALVGRLACVVVVRPAGDAHDGLLLR